MNDLVQQRTTARHGKRLCNEKRRLADAAWRNGCRYDSPHQHPAIDPRSRIDAGGWSPGVGRCGYAPLGRLSILKQPRPIRRHPQRINAFLSCEAIVALAVQEWIAAVGAKTAYIEPGSPWENGYIGSFNARLRDELLNGEIFYSLAEAKVVIESWRRHVNAVRPHGSLGYRAPAPEVFVPALAAWPAPRRASVPPAILPLAKEALLN